MNKRLLLGIFLVTIVLVGGAFLFVWQSNDQQKVAVSDSSTQKQASGLVRYENSTIGLAFYYPKDWLINEGAFSGGKGDVMKDGKIYTTFGINIFPPNWDSQKQSNIGIGHYPYVSQDGKSFDNMSVNEQLALIDCAAPHKYGGYDAEYQCEMRRSKNGVVYTWETGYVKQKAEGYGARAMVPTGKYILTFSIMDGTLESYERDIEIFKKVIDSVELR